MLTVPDDLAVRILNRVLQLLVEFDIEDSWIFSWLRCYHNTYLSTDVVTPFRRATSYLAVSTTTLSAMLSMRLIFVMTMPILTFHLMVAFVDAVVQLLSEASAVAEASLAALAFTSEATLTVVVIFELPLLRRRVCTTLLCATAGVR